MSEKHCPILHAAAFIALAGVTGCVPSASSPPEHETPIVAQPGKVLVDHDARRIELKSGGDKLCRIWESDLRKRAIPPLVEVQAPSGYGIDDRFAGPRDDMMRLGAACLKNEGAPCRTIVDTMLAWSNADAAIVRTSGDDSPFWNDSITVNLEVVRPFVGAYAIARASVPVAPDEDALIRQPDYVQSSRRLGPPHSWDRGHPCPRGPRRAFGRPRAGSPRSQEAATPGSRGTGLMHSTTCYVQSSGWGGRFPGSAGFQPAGGPFELCT